GGGGRGGADYNAPTGGSNDDPWATGGATNFGDEPPF
ncbi:MAG: single-stranded DNA-binding protein, partial [Actinobacteria bacterium]|nr:single-stranded DNA-binding protein [Actinomycetota bacterium]